MSEFKKNGIGKILPVLFGFFVMGFCDVVGISTSYIKIDFNLSETMAGFIPTMVFFWFLLLSVPTAILMNRIGRKRSVQLSNVVTIIGMMIPFFSYNIVTCMIAFALLGIGNTILQVSLNPLLTNVVKGERLTSSLTAGQVVKAVSSFCGPFIAAFAAYYFGTWKALFPIFAGITIISSLWLAFTHLPEEKRDITVSGSAANIKNTFSLLKDPALLLLFLGIVAVVGVDVGTNTLAPKLLMERCSMDVETAGYGSSVYFLCRTIGAFIGAVLLMKMSEKRYFKIHISLAVITALVLFFVSSKPVILILLGLLGYSISTVFPIIYSMALRRSPDKANEISGLLITGVVGGAIVPPMMGFFADLTGSQVGSLIVISFFILYLASLAFWNKKVKRT
ncbi:MAG: MFS transporter [Bacteroidales bacterium]|nr:MFS transporter [Bacteroidales bacterium]